MATFNDKLERIISNISNRIGTVNIIQGTKLYDIAESISYDAFQLESILERNNEENSIANAKGLALDKIGINLFDIERRKSKVIPITSDMNVIKFYVKNGNFGNINNGKNIIIPEGTLLSGSYKDQTFTFRTSEETVLESSLYEKYISVELVIGDIDSIPAGSIKSHNFTNYAQSIAKTLLVTNISPFMSRIPEESDDNYRYRIYNSRRAYIQNNISGIQEMISSYPGVSNVTIVPYSNGGGTFTAYVQGTSPVTSDSLIEDVEILVLQNVPSWATYNILKPYYIGLEVDITLQMKNPELYSANTGFLDEIKNNISNYINNFYGTQIYLIQILKYIESLHEDILNAKYNILKIYTGLGEMRSFNQIDLSLDTNPILYITNIEKLITEPISSPIIIRIE